MKRSFNILFALGLIASTLPAAQAVTTIVPPGDWGSMQTVVGSNPSHTLIYEFTVTPDQPLTISTSFTASTYAPNAYEAGFVSPGWFYVRRACATCSYEGDVIWDMGKPYTENFNTAYTMLLIGGPGRGDEVADYVPGASYQSTLVWDRAAAKIDITVTGPGLNVTRRVDSSGDTITGLVFQGPNFPLMGPSAFGNVSVITQAVPEPETYALMLAGLAAVGYLAYRRQA